jgi:hypothetical protein
MWDVVEWNDVNTALGEDGSADLAQMEQLASGVEGVSLHEGKGFTLASVVNIFKVGFLPSSLLSFLLSFVHAFLLSFIPSSFAWFLPYHYSFLEYSLPSFRPTFFSFKFPSFLHSSKCPSFFPSFETSDDLETDLLKLEAHAAKPRKGANPGTGIPADCIFCTGMSLLAKSFVLDYPC